MAFYTSGDTIMNALGKLLALAALGVTAFNATASAEPPRGPNIIIAGEDADKDTIPRGNRNFNRIQRAIAEQLLARGFKVFDETAVTPHLPQGRKRRQLPELLQSAKWAKAPIDIIVVFQIYASVRPMPHVHDTYQPFVRVDGRLLKVRGGQDLGGFEFGSDIEFGPIPGSCVNGKPPGECVIEAVGDQARLIGSAVGNALATKLAVYLRPDKFPGVALPTVSSEAPIVGKSEVHNEGKFCDGMDGTPYVLRIRDFDGTELNRLEEAFTSFACYQHHRVMVSQPGMTDYWYE